MTASALARRLIERRGLIGEGECEAFLAAGFGKDHLLDAIAVSAASTITNYAGNVTNQPPEAAFQLHAWKA